MNESKTIIDFHPPNKNDVLQFPDLVECLPFQGKMNSTFRLCWSSSKGKLNHVFPFVGSSSHELYFPVTEINAGLQFIKHANDVLCHPSRTVYPISEMFCQAQPCVASVQRFQHFCHRHLRRMVNWSLTVVVRNEAVAWAYTPFFPLSC